MVLAFDGMQFETSKNVLESKWKELKQKGKGNRPHKAKGLSDEEIEMLWQSGCLGSHSPESLLNLVWYYNTKLLGLHGCDENI